MKTKIKNIIVSLLASMIFGFVCAEEDAKEGVSKITITNHTPFSFKFTFMPGKKNYSEVQTLDQLTTAKVGSNEQKIISANPGERLAYEGSELGIDALGVKDPTKFQETLDWKSNTLTFGLGFYDGGHDVFWPVAVIIELQYIDKDNLQINITEGEIEPSPQKY